MTRSRTVKALARLVELHDEQPPMLTESDWAEARAALKGASSKAMAVRLTEKELDTLKDLMLDAIDAGDHNALEEAYSGSASALREVEDIEAMYQTLFGESLAMDNCECAICTHIRRKREGKHG